MKTADKETATELPLLAAGTRYVLLIVSGMMRNNERLHVVEFRNAKEAKSAKFFLDGFSDKFQVKILDDSV